MVDQLRGSWEKLRGGRYLVKRGAMAWPSFDFEANPYAVAIMLDAIRPLTHGIGTPCRLAFEVGCRMPNPEEEPNIDDGLFDELIDDVERVVHELMLARSPGATEYSVTFSLKTESAVVAEWHDADLMIQGLTFTIDCTY